MCSTCVSDRIERCEWCKHRPKHVCGACLEKCVHKALARHGIEQKQEEEEEEAEDDESTDEAATS